MQTCKSWCEFNRWIWCKCCSLCVSGTNHIVICCSVLEELNTCFVDVVYLCFFGGYLSYISLDHGEQIRKHSCFQHEHFLALIHTILYLFSISVINFENWSIYIYMVALTWIWKTTKVWLHYWPLLVMVPRCVLCLQYTSKCSYTVYWSVLVWDRLQYWILRRYYVLFLKCCSSLISIMTNLYIYVYIYSPYRLVLNILSTQCNVTS